MRSTDASSRCLGWLLPMFLVAACTTSSTGASNTSEVRLAQGSPDQVAHGRFLVISHDCGGCHGGGSDPAAKGWLAGVMSPDMEFKIGPCYVDPAAKPCFTTRPKNLTP